jgi:hypothetical protein
MVHELPDVAVAVGAQAGAPVFGFNIVASPNSFDFPVAWSSTPETQALGVLVFNDDTQAAGTIVSTGQGGTGRYTAHVDGVKGPGQYAMERALVVTFVPGPAVNFDFGGEVLVAPTEVEPDFATDTTETPAA